MSDLEPTSQEIREALAEAASSVDSITCSPYFVQTTKPGDAVVRLDHVDYPSRLGGSATWQVAVMLPQDYASAEAFLDDIRSDLFLALSEVMNVTRVTPGQLALTDATVPVVFFEGTREDNIRPSDVIVERDS